MIRANQPDGAIKIGVLRANQFARIALRIARATKNTTESKFGTGSKIRYGDKKTLRRLLLRNACFPKRKKRKSGTDYQKLWP